MQPLILFLPFIFGIVNSSRNSGRSAETHYYKIWRNISWFSYDPLESWHQIFLVKYKFAAAIIDHRNLYAKKTGYKLQEEWHIDRANYGAEYYLQLPKLYRLGVYVPFTSLMAYGMSNSSSYPALASLLLLQQAYRWRLSKVRDNIDFTSEDNIPAYPYPEIESQVCAAISALSVSYMMKRATLGGKSAMIPKFIPFMAVTCADFAHFWASSQSPDDLTWHYENHFPGYFISHVAANFSIYGVAPILMHMSRKYTTKLPLLMYHGLYLLTSAACVRYLFPFTQAVSPFYIKCYQ